MKKLLVILGLCLMPFVSKAAVTGDFTGEDQISLDDVIYLFLYFQNPNLTTTTLTSTAQAAIPTLKAATKVPSSTTGDFTGEGQISLDDVIYLFLYFQNPNLTTTTLTNTAQAAISTLKAATAKPGTLLSTTTAKCTVPSTFGTIATTTMANVPLNSSSPPPVGVQVPGSPTVTLNNTSLSWTPATSTSSPSGYTLLVSDVASSACTSNNSTWSVVTPAGTTTSAISITTTGVTISATTRAYLVVPYLLSTSVLTTTSRCIQMAEDTGKYRCYGEYGSANN